MHKKDEFLDKKPAFAGFFYIFVIDQNNLL